MAQLQYVYDKYVSSYYNTNTLERMIDDAIRIGENSCLLFEEHASANEPTITADDLERLFEKGLGDRESIGYIIKQQVIAFRHILKIRTAVTRDCVTPIVSVQYILVWKKNQSPPRLLKQSL